MGDHRVIRIKKPTPIRELFEMLCETSMVTASLKPFGQATYTVNESEMGKEYAHPETGEIISFRPATVRQTIAIAGYMQAHARDKDAPNEFDIKKSILYTSRLQAGRIVRTKDGVWIDVKGEFNEDAVKKLLTDNRNVNGIYLLGDNGAFVPYGFKTGSQEHGEFLEGGLARAMEHTRLHKAVKLEALANKTLYPNNVYVLGFEPVSGSVERVLYLDSDWGLGGDRLFVGDFWDDVNGCAFGVRSK